jgi:uncharacterized protein
VLIVDTGPLVAPGDRDDRSHAACRELLETDPGPLVTTALVIAEAGYMLSRGLGVAAELALIAMIRDGSLGIEALTGRIGTASISSSGRTPISGSGSPTQA